MGRPVGRPKTGRPIKNQVLQLRLTEEEKAYIMDVAALEAETAAEFILKAVRERAERLRLEQEEFDESIRSDLRNWDSGLYD